MTVNQSQDLISVPVTGTVTGTVTVSGLSKAGLITYVTIDDTQWWALPPTSQPSRNSVAIQNLSATQVLLNFSPSAPSNQGWTIYVNGEFSIDVTNNIPIYARAVSAGSFTLVIMELS